MGRRVRRVFLLLSQLWSEFSVESENQHQSLLGLTALLMLPTAFDYATLDEENRYQC